MDFRVDEDQQALREGIRAFCRGRVAVERLRELEGRGATRELWRELAEMGVFALRRPESAGGLELGNAEAVLVFEELGRALVPGPLVWSHLAAGLVDGAAEGTALVGGLDLFDGEGPPCVVEHLEALDALLLLRPEGVFRVEPGVLEARSAAPLDPLTPVHEVAALPTGERLAGGDEARRLRLEGAALVAGQLLGIAEASQELATAYAKERRQFGRPIGSFQSLKHILADCFVRQEAARAAAYAAAATLDDPGVGDVARAVAGAKLCAGEAAQKNARACIQVHGGMGYTWEVPAHYFLKRSWVLATLFGTGEEHAAALAAVAAGS